MAHYWKLLPSADSRTTVPLAGVGQLLSRLGQAGPDAAAEALLGMMGEHVALAQCTIFAFDPGRRPRVLAVGDRLRTRALPTIAEAYVRRYHRLDGLAEVMDSELANARKTGSMNPAIYLHRQAAGDIAHEGYRQTCYELPQVAERLVVLALYEGRRWLTVHLYRGLEHGLFTDRDVDLVAEFAPLIVHAVRLHHTGQALRHDLPSELDARLAERHPELSPRDHDVIRALLAGMDTRRMAAALGVTASSAQTYCKRLYRKLGVAGKGELMAKVLSGQP